MFDSFRDKIQSVQEGIAASLQRIASGDSTRRNPINENVNLNAGADILHFYQTEWQNSHQLTEENAAKAQAIDETIGQLFNTFEKQWLAVTQLSSSVAAIPQLTAATQTLMEQLGDLQELFDEVEHGLLQLEDIIETQELQERQLDHRFQLALYKEKKLQELDKVRESLVSEHSNKMVKHQIQQSHTLRERQETFGQAFEDDLEHFRLTGKLPVSPEKKVELMSTSLEEVTLDDDPAALNQFLEDNSS